MWAFLYYEIFLILFLWFDKTFKTFILFIHDKKSIYWVNTCTAKSAKSKRTELLLLFLIHLKLTVKPLTRSKRRRMWSDSNGSQNEFIQVRLTSWNVVLFNINYHHETKVHMNKNMVWIFHLISSFKNIYIPMLYSWISILFVLSIFEDSLTFSCTH